MKAASYLLLPSLQRKLMRVRAGLGKDLILKEAETLFPTVRPFLICEVHDETNAAFVTGWLNEQNYQSRRLENESSFPRYIYASPLS